jgi:hypothetical protein
VQRRRPASCDAVDRDRRRGGALFGRVSGNAAIILFNATAAAAMMRRFLEALSRLI